MHTYRETDRHTYIHPYKHTYIQTYILTFVYTHIHTYTHIHACWLGWRSLNGLGGLLVCRFPIAIKSPSASSSTKDGNCCRPSPVNLMADSSMEDAGKSGAGRLSFTIVFERTSQVSHGRAFHRISSSGPKLCGAGK